MYKPVEMFHPNHNWSMCKWYQPMLAIRLDKRQQWWNHRRIIDKQIPYVYWKNRTKLLFSTVFVNKLRSFKFDLAHLIKNGRNGAIILTVMDGIVSANSKIPVDIILQSRDAWNNPYPWSYNNKNHRESRISLNCLQFPENVYRNAI